jgi:hypothetical protein
LRHARHNEGLRYLLLCIERHTQWLVTADLKNRALTRVGPEYDESVADNVTPPDYLNLSEYEELFDETFDPADASDSDSSDSDYSDSEQPLNGDRAHDAADAAKDVPFLGAQQPSRLRVQTPAARFQRHEAGTAALFPDWVFPEGTQPKSRPDAVIFEGITSRNAHRRPTGPYKIVIIEFTYTSEMSEDNAETQKLSQHAALLEQLRELHDNVQLIIVKTGVRGTSFVSTHHPLKLLGITGRERRRLELDWSWTARVFNASIIWTRRKLESQAAYSASSGREGYTRYKSALSLHRSHQCHPP